MVDRLCPRVSRSQHLVAAGRLALEEGLGVIRRSLGRAQRLARRLVQLGRLLLVTDGLSEYSAGWNTPLHLFASTHQMVLLTGCSRC